MSEWRKNCNADVVRKTIKSTDIIITDNYRYKKWFRFKLAWDCKISFFEFDSYDDDNDLIHLKAYPKEGEPYDTQMEFLDYEESFFNEDYLPLERS